MATDNTEPPFGDAELEPTAEEMASAQALARLLEGGQAADPGAGEKVDPAVVSAAALLILRSGEERCGDAVARVREELALPAAKVARWKPSVVSWTAAAAIAAGLALAVWWPTRLAQRLPQDYQLGPDVKAAQLAVLAGQTEAWAALVSATDKRRAAWLQEIAQ